MAWLICRTRSNKYDIVNTEKITQITVSKFEEGGFYKVEIYPDQFEGIPLTVALKDQDNVGALLTALRSDSYFIIENGEIDLWKGQDLFMKHEDDKGVGGNPTRDCPAGSPSPPPGGRTKNQLNDRGGKRD